MCVYMSEYGLGLVLAKPLHVELAGSASAHVPAMQVGMIRMGGSGYPGCPKMIKH